MGVLAGEGRRARRKGLVVMDKNVAWEMKKLIPRIEKVCAEMEILCEEEPDTVRQDVADVVTILHDALWEMDRLTQATE